jgi:hypothetical protein
MDSVRADDLLLACCGELPESDAEGSVGVSYLRYLNEDMWEQGTEEEMTGTLKKLHNEELYNLYSSPIIIRMINSRRMGYLEHVAHVGEMKNVYKILVTLKVKDCFEVLCVDRIIILKRMLQQIHRMAGSCGLGSSGSG